MSTELTIQLDEGQAHTVSFAVDLASLKFDDEHRSWIQALPIGSYKHPTYGDINVTPERVQRFAANVNEGVRGIELDIDFDHKARSGEAAGWVKRADARSDGLWLQVEWTEDAASAIRGRKYRYFSPEFVDSWTHPESTETIKDVMFGGAITNRPFLKNILPLNLSEVGGDMNPFLRALAEKLGLTGDDVTDDQVLAKLRSHYKLSEDASEGDIVTKMLAEPDPPKKKDDDKKKKDDDKKLSEEDEAIKTLAEDNPAVAALLKRLEDQDVTIGKIMATQQLAEVETAVTKLSHGDHAIPPKFNDQLQQMLVGMGSDQRGQVVKFLSDLTADGMVDMREHGKNPGTPGGKDASQTIHERVQALMKGDDGMTYSEAIEQIAAQEPKLFAEYRRSAQMTDRQEV